MVLLRSTYSPVAVPAIILAASSCACLRVPRSVTNLVTRRPVIGSRPVSNFRRQLVFPRRVRLPFIFGPLGSMPVLETTASDAMSDLFAWTDRPIYPGAADFHQAAEPLRSRLCA